MLPNDMACSTSLSYNMLISRYIVFLFLSVCAQQQKDDLYAQVDTNLLFVDIVGCRGLKAEGVSRGYICQGTGVSLVKVDFDEEQVCDGNCCA